MNLDGKAFFEPDHVVTMERTHTLTITKTASIRVTKLLSWMPNGKITKEKRVYGITRVMYKQRV